jgi:hypothetical protein
MATLFAPEVFKNHYLNLFLTSIDDPVAEVRIGASKSFGKICIALETDYTVFSSFKAKVNQMATS